MTTNRSPNHSDFVTLKEYIESRLTAIEKATEVAHRSMEHRLNAMNEFRESLKDQSNLFLTKAEYIACKEKIDEDIRLLRESRAELHGKASQMQANIALGIAIIGILLSIYFGLR